MVSRVVVTQARVGGSQSMIGGPRGAGRHQGEHPRGDSKPGHQPGHQQHQLRNSCNFIMGAAPPPQSLLCPVTTKTVASPQPPAGADGQHPGPAAQVLLRAGSQQKEPSAGSSWRGLLGGWAGGMQRPLGVQGEVLLRWGWRAVGEAGHRLTSVTSVGVLVGWLAG